MDSSLGLASAQRIVSQAVEDARRASVRISVAVADEAGVLLAFARMDGATRLSARTAVDKTQTVILTGKATLDLGQEWREDLSVEPELFYGMIARPNVVPFGGGVPVRVEGQAHRCGRGIRRDQRPGPRHRGERRGGGGLGRLRRTRSLGGSGGGHYPPALLLLVFAVGDRPRHEDAHPDIRRDL